MQTLEHTVRLLDNALFNMSNNRDCEYLDNSGKQPSPCDCPVCEAKAMLLMTREWRYVGAHHNRVTNGHNPREMRMIVAWKNQVDDKLLATLLYNGPLDGRGAPREPVFVPSARDWFVATTIVQWLATNVGMAVLQAAGFKYSLWDEDRARHAEKEESKKP